jgi:hypothetical protein
MDSISFKFFNTEINNIYNNVLDHTYLLLNNSVINKFSYKNEIIDKYLQISIRIPKQYTKYYNGYEYIPLSKLPYTNINNILNHLNLLIENINNQFYNKLVSKYPQYKFINSNNEIYIYK